jgi:hypothetical protein
VSSRTKLFTFTSAAIVLAACSDRREQQPAAVTGIETPRFALSLPTGCDLNQIRANTAAFFTFRTDPVFNAVARLDEAVSLRGPVAAILPAFDAIKRISIVVGTPDQKGTATVGNNLTRGIFLCTSIPLPPGFDVTAALEPGGMFSVRGNDTKDGPRNPVLSRSDPAFDPWVIEPFFDPQTQTWKTWQQSSGGTRFLVYGAKIPPFTPETPATRTSFFEIKTIPDHQSFAPALVVGVCTQNASGRERLQHEGSIYILVAPQFCQGNNPFQGASAARPSAIYAAMQRAFDLFSPPKLIAQGFIGGVGGRPSDFSPHAIVDGVALTIQFVVQPHDATAAKPITEPYIRVKVTTEKGTPVQGVLVTLRPFGTINDVAVKNNKATTDLNGIAVFPNFTVMKAGSFMVVANSALSGFAVSTAASTGFVIH